MELTLKGKINPCGNLDFPVLRITLNCRFCSHAVKTWYVCFWQNKHDYVTVILHQVIYVHLCFWVKVFMLMFFCVALLSDFNLRLDWKQF